MLQVNKRTVQRWLIKARETPCLQEEKNIQSRIPTRGDGTWIYDSETARILLEVVDSLSTEFTEHEKNILHLLNIYGSVRAVAQACKLKEDTLRKTLANIRGKVKNEGLALAIKRRNLISFLRDFETYTENDLRIKNSILEAGGNVEEAARLLGCSRIEVVNLLKKWGYYRS